MKTLKTMVAALAASTAMFVATAPAQALDELTVAYFLEWPTPNQYAQANKIYEKARIFTCGVWCKLLIVTRLL